MSGTRRGGKRGRGGPVITLSFDRPFWLTAWRVGREPVGVAVVRACKSCMHVHESHMIVLVLVISFSESCRASSQLPDLLEGPLPLMRDGAVVVKGSEEKVGGGLQMAGVRRGGLMARGRGGVSVQGGVVEQHSASCV